MTREAEWVALLRRQGVMPLACWMQVLCTEQRKAVVIHAESAPQAGENSPSRDSTSSNCCDRLASKGGMPCSSTMSSSTSWSNWT